MQNLSKQNFNALIVGFIERRNFKAVRVEAADQKAKEFKVVKALD